jgi:hypothetical protein
MTKESVEIRSASPEITAGVGRSVHRLELALLVDPGDGNVERLRHRLTLGGKVLQLVYVELRILEGRSRPGDLTVNEEFDALLESLREDSLLPVKDVASQNDGDEDDHPDNEETTKRRTSPEVLHHVPS